MTKKVGFEALGPTGRYPQGSLGPHDEGELKISISHDDEGRVHINFGKDIRWIAVTRLQAVELANLILAHAAMPNEGGGQ